MDVDLEQQMTPEQFVQSLEEISTEGGVPYARAHSLLHQQAKYGRNILKLRGYLALSNAAKCFFLETIELVNEVRRPQVCEPFPSTYALFLPRLVHCFQSLCAAETVATRGYPYHAYTLLRNVYDNTVLASAALQRLTDFYSIEGVVEGKPFKLEAAKRLRKSTEFAVRQKMYGTKSGLSEGTIRELTCWDAMFDYETHGARLSLTQSMGWMKGTDPLSVVPAYDESAFGMFMNRYCEVGWMIHRLIPLIQPSDAPLPDAWGVKWRTIDHAFRLTVESLTKQLLKPIGAAVAEFVLAKFPFTERSCFPA